MGSGGYVDNRYSNWRIRLRIIKKKCKDSPVMNVRINMKRSFTTQHTQAVELSCHKYVQKTLIMLLTLLFPLGGASELSAQMSYAQGRSGYTNYHASQTPYRDEAVYPASNLQTDYSGTSASPAASPAVPEHFYSELPGLSGLDSNSNVVSQGGRDSMRSVLPKDSDSASVPVPAAAVPVPAASVPVPAASVPVPAASVPVPAASVPVPAASDNSQYNISGPNSSAAYVITDGRVPQVGSDTRQYAYGSSYPVESGYDFGAQLPKPGPEPMTDYNRLGHGMKTSEPSRMSLRDTESYPADAKDILPERLGEPGNTVVNPAQESYSYFTDTTTSASPVCQHCGEGYGCPYLWSVDANVTLKTRSGAGKNDKILAYSAYDAGSEETGYSPIYADTSYGVAPGLDMTVSRYLGRNVLNADVWVDFHYDGLYNWNKEDIYIENQLVTEGILSFIPGLGPISDADGTYYYPNKYDINYRSTYNSGEVVFRFRQRRQRDLLVMQPDGRWNRECQGGLSYTHSLGVRYTFFDGWLDWSGFIYNGGDVNSDPLVTGRMKMSVENRMLGLVLGGDLVDKHCSWSWGLRWRAIPYLNFINTRAEAESTEMFSLGNGYVKRYRSDAQKNDVAVELKAGLYAQWKIRPHFILHAGYDWSWVSNVALAADNVELDVYGRSRIQSTGDVMISGVTLGGMFVW